MAPLYALLVGVAMGVLIQRVRASSPGMILQNLRLENLSIIKFMATTIAVGMIAIYVLDLFIPQAMHFDVKPAYVVGVALGGLIFGVGFALGGYCPGTCVVGAGEGRKDALWAVGGGVVGALLFTLLYNVLFDPFIKPMDLGKVRLQDYIHIPTVVLALLVAGIMLTIVKILPTTPGRPTTRRRRIRRRGTSPET
ncbi:MAG TPA: YeeE/YedE thiosulfate transporter family protein, partial [Gemmatimonadaceae bacterium]|nr:YeeE/YedE thiosulfate transporter family protein [Gemmatimonadaceae bacterium]